MPTSERLDDIETRLNGERHRIELVLDDVAFLLAETRRLMAEAQARADADAEALHTYEGNDVW